MSLAQVVDGTTKTLMLSENLHAMSYVYQPKTNPAGGYVVQPFVRIQRHNGYQNMPPEHERFPDFVENGLGKTDWFPPCNQNTTQKSSDHVPPDERPIAISHVRHHERYNGGANGSSRFVQGQQRKLHILR